MLELVYPWALTLVVLPVVMHYLPAYKESRDSVRVPFFDKLVELSEERPQTGALVLQRDRIQRVLVGLTWLMLVLAAAKPQWVGEPIEQQKSGRDLMIAVDLSGSMAAKDFTLEDGSQIDRLEAVKHVLGDLRAQRSADRLGLIVFGNASYLQAPFTDDHAVWGQLLDETQIGMAGQSTVFGDAIGLAIKLFNESDSDNQVLIILTDGNDTGSMVPPIDAAKVAAHYDIRIYTIAIGDPATVGEDALDLHTLERVSEITGGQHFQALDREQLGRAYRAIAELEPELYESVSFRPKQSLHWLPIALSLVLYLLYHSVNAVLDWHRRRAHRVS